MSSACFYSIKKEFRKCQQMYVHILEGGVGERTKVWMQGTSERQQNRPVTCPGRQREQNRNTLMQHFCSETFFLLEHFWDCLIFLNNIYTCFAYRLSKLECEGGSNSHYINSKSTRRPCWHRQPKSNILSTNWPLNQSHQILIQCWSKIGQNTSWWDETIIWQNGLHV